MKKPTWKEMIGTTIGNWEILQRDYHPISKQHSTFFKCKCLGCGQIFSVSRDSLLSSKTKNLGCQKCAQLPNKQKSKYYIPIGTTFGFLTTVSESYSKNLKSYIKCKCSCGKCSGQDILEIRKDHLLGLQREGRTISCGLAKISSGELKIKQILDENNIIYQQQYRIKDFNIYSPFDFAILNQNGQLIKLIQYDGEQHFKPVQLWGGEQHFKIQQDRDQKKNEYCQTRGIKLLRIPYTQFNNISLEMLMK